MRMSTKGRFAVDAMIDLALRDAAGPVALVTISGRQRVSLSYLEQLFAGLRSRELVQSTRGPGGGYSLARAADEISVADIVSAVDDFAQARLTDAASAGAAQLWARLDVVMLGHMAGITLQSLVDEHAAQGLPVAPQPPRRATLPTRQAKPALSSAPNSVFALARSMAR